MRAIILAIVGLLFCSPVSADWPGWLGPKRDGWVANFQPPVTWPTEIEQVWRIDVGVGYGSPLVLGDAVFQHGRQGDDETVTRADLSTGEVQWQKKFAVPFKMGGGGEWHGKGPKSSPVMADGRLFTVSISGQISAWDTETGDRLWIRDYAETKYKRNHPYWGAAMSPIVDENRLLLHVGNDDQGHLVALDVKTGEEIWTQGDDGASYSSPLIATIRGVRQVVDWNHNSLAGVEAVSGKLLWTHPFPHVGSNQNMPTPTVINGRVLLGGENRGLVCLEPLRSDTGKWSVEEKWFQDKVALDMSSAVANKNLLYGFSHYGRGRLFCLDTNSGKILWQGPGRTGDNVAFLSVPGYVLALLDKGELRVIKATGESYQAVVTYQVADSPTWAPPVLLQDGVLVKDHDTLIRWKFK